MSQGRTDRILSKVIPRTSHIQDVAAVRRVLMTRLAEISFEAGSRYAVRRGRGTVVHTVKSFDKNHPDALLYCERVRLAHIDLMREPREGLAMCRTCESRKAVRPRGGVAPHIQRKDAA